MRCNNPPQPSVDDDDLDDELNDGWDIDITEKDDGSQMASYIFDPEYKGEQKTKWEKIVLDAIVDPRERYFGWEDDAIATGLLTEAEVRQLIELEGDTPSGDSDEVELISIDDVEANPNDKELDVIAAEDDVETLSTIDDITKDPFGSLDETEMVRVANGMPIKDIDDEIVADFEY